MEPEYLTATYWGWIASFVEAILWFTLLAIVGALSLLVAHAVVPSLIITNQLAARARLLRYGAYAASLVSFGVAFYILSVVLGYAFAIINSVFPRWWI